MIKKPLYKSVPTVRNYEDYISKYYTKGWNDAMDYIFQEAKEKREKEKIKKNISIVKRMPKGGNMKDRYLYKAVNNIFGDSYEYTKKYKEFCKKKGNK